jgi:ABC-type amino acid transport substrate-binding protein
MRPTRCSTALTIMPRTSSPLIPPMVVTKVMASGAQQSRAKANPDPLAESALRKGGATVASETRLRSRRHLLAGLAGAITGSWGCSKADAATRFSTLHPGVLRIGTYFVNPPFEFLSGGKRVGFEVELMEAIAVRLNLQPVFVNTEWETILQQTQEGRYDCIVGGITITPRREQTLAWSTPYLTTTLSLIIDQNRSPGLHSLSDLAHLTVGVQAATTDLDAATVMWKAGQIGAVKIYPFAQIADAVLDLRSGRIGAVMKVRPVAQWFVRGTPGLRILAQVPNDPQPLGIGFNRNSTGLLAAVNEAICDMAHDRSLTRLAHLWQVV